MLLCMICKSPSREVGVERGQKQESGGVLWRFQM